MLTAETMSLRRGYHSIARWYRRYLGIGLGPSVPSAAVVLDRVGARGHDVSLTIERLEEGEVSPYLCDVLHVGDGLEVRGPIGGYFVWNREQTGRLLLIVGGSGIVPLMAMLRHRARAEVTTRAAVPVRLIYSAHAGPCHLPGRDRAAHERSGLEVTITLTRQRECALSGSGRPDNCQR